MSLGKKGELLKKTQTVLTWSIIANINQNNNGASSNTVRDNNVKSNSVESGNIRNNKNKRKKTAMSWN